MNRPNYYFIGLVIILAGLLSCSKEEDPISSQEQLAMDIEIIDDYLAANNITAEEHPSGLRYIITKDVFGEHPETSDIISINYEGRLLSDNTVFDSGDSIDYPLSRLIVGWQIGLPLIGEGSSITLYVPSGYAYGRNGAGSSIPANANLIFDIDLLEVK